MEFIPVAEECGLIQPLGDWVLEEACRNAHLVLDKEEADESLFISVNLSVHQLTKPNLAERIEDLLEQYRIKSHNLKLEITETVLMKNAFSVIPTLERLRMLGVRLAIDDFGTGYSSLSYLHYLPVDTLKVDKAFIRELDDHMDRPRIIQTIMRLAQSMNKIVVAEGVETMEQYQVLRSMDCHYVQGYLFGKPMELSRPPPCRSSRLSLSTPAPDPPAALASACRPSRFSKATRVSTK